MSRAPSILAILLLFTGVACSPYGATQRPKQEDLVADYIPTNETLKRLKRDGYPDRDTVITLKQDGSLSLQNIPDCWLSSFGDPGGKFDSGIGRWELVKTSAVWAVTFHIAQFTADSADYLATGLDCLGCATVLNNKAPHGLAIAVAAGDKGFLEFRRR